MPTISPSEDQRRQAGPYIIDGGCFITQSNELFVLDPSYMASYIEAMINCYTSAPGTNASPSSPVNGDSGQLTNNRTNNRELPNDGESRSSECGIDERGASHHPSSSSSNDPHGSSNTTCCMVHQAKSGMWSVYAVCEDFPSAFHEREDDDEDNPVDDGAEDSKVLSSLVILNNSEIHMEMVNPDFLNSLPWQPSPASLQSNHAPLPAGVLHRPYVSVESGQIGIFCPESIRLPSGLLQNSNADDPNCTSTVDKVRKWLSMWFERLLELTCTGNQVGIMDVVGAPLGAVCASGLGDHGEYAVQVLKDDRATDEVYGCRIVFV